MAAEVSDEIKDALNLIVNTTEKSGNRKKGLKQTIYETVSTLRNLFVKLKDSRDSKAAEITKLEKQVNTMKTQLEECCGSKAKYSGTPSVIRNNEPAGNTARRVAPPGGEEGNPNTETAVTTARRVAPSSCSERKLYSEAVEGVKKTKRFQLTVKTTLNQPPETIKEILKCKINPTEIKVGINTFKLLKMGQSL
jgi:hypothetical protein